MATDAVGTEPTASSDPSEPPLPIVSRRGIGLCLSGGGYRATLFHLGALLRLNELGIFARMDFRTITSVSGGSITAAWLATALARHAELRVPGPIPRETWNRFVREPLRAFTKRDIRTGAVAKRFLPWNWLRTSTGVETLAATYERELTDLRLAAMPAKPDFILCATDMAYGVNWVFQRDRMGDWQAGYRDTPADYPLGRAVAASACFPPVFNPLPLDIEPSELTRGKAKSGPERDACIRGLRLTDGGAYDNMGLEPVWKSHAFVLVSDAGGLFTDEGDKGLVWRIPRYQGIQERQARALRKRWLISGFDKGELDGTYWSVGGSRASYEMTGGYSEELAKQTIAQIRTDLDAFSDAEAAVLENHGYLLADAAIGKYATPLLAAAPPSPLEVPHPEWMDEEKVKKALASSARRRLLGRDS